jgi:hypothetical protein
MPGKPVPSVGWQTEAWKERRRGVSQRLRLAEMMPMKEIRPAGRRAGTGGAPV